MIFIVSGCDTDATTNDETVVVVTITEDEHGVPLKALTTKKVVGEEENT